MIQDLPDIQLKNGERAKADMILAPQESWRAGIIELLRHKGEPWLWQIARLLDGQHKIESRFYLLHQDGVPFCNILTIENNGVGLLGHVWTKPEMRGQGAASQLLRLAMADFRMRRGRALFLGTGFESAAFHLYRRQGFESVEQGSGVMAFFCDGRETFESDYFAPGETVIAALNWSHYATASALLAHRNPTRLRCLPLGVLQPGLCESAFLPLLREHKNGDEMRALVLQKSGGEVVGIVAWLKETLWPEITEVDIFCHENFWHCGEELLKALPIPKSKRLVIYDDEQNPAKTALLQRAGFEMQVRLKNRVPRDGANHALDVSSWERAG